ncbi:hypothetical protein L1987_36092 [Smallanthus sonchifolius]|uniref:Uncharacterized protein n=1 Tax=Smallanthus sonchifolius TaxID=185202 RepID=A0ACB9HDU4_9ASTR|nr:hypothetical protein L1987_36092 [Smallanthus sonchifolius]
MHGLGVASIASHGVIFNSDPLLGFPRLNLKPKHTPISRYSTPIFSNKQVIHQTKGSNQRYFDCSNRWLGRIPITVYSSEGFHGTSQSASLKTPLTVLAKLLTLR